MSFQFLSRINVVEGRRMDHKDEEILAENRDRKIKVYHEVVQARFIGRIARLRVAPFLPPLGRCAGYPPAAVLPNMITSLIFPK